MNGCHRYEEEQILNNYLLGCHLSGKHPKVHLSSASLSCMLMARSKALHILLNPGDLSFLNDSTIPSIAAASRSFESQVEFMMKENKA